MNQRIYFSGVGEIDLWSTSSGRVYLDNAAHMLSFFSWDATPDLVQATWEWPHKPLLVSKAAWEQIRQIKGYSYPQKPHMQRQFYGN